MLIKRPPPAVGAVLLYLAVYVTAADLTPYYYMWFIPFLLLAGWWRAATVVQVLLLIPLVLVFLPAMGITSPQTVPHGIADAAYVVWSDLMLGLCAVGAAIVLTRYVIKPTGSSCQSHVK